MTTFDDFKYPIGSLVQFRAAPMVRGTVSGHVLVSNGRHVDGAYMMGVLGKSWGHQLVSERPWYFESELELASEAEARKA